MIRTEFDQKVRDLKKQRSEALRVLDKMLLEVKEELSAKNRQISDLCKEVTKIKQSQVQLKIKRNDLSVEWNKKIDGFIKEYESTTTSNLADVSVSNIIYELRRRGYSGIVSKDWEDGGHEEHDIQYQYKPKTEEET